MENNVNYVAVGAFVLFLGAALVVCILWLASGGATRKAFDLYRAIEDESVSGLNLNAPVKYNGVEVGHVRQIQLDPDNPERVNLLFAIEQDTVIKEDTVAMLKTQGLTGIAYIELSGGSPASLPLRPVEGSQFPVIRTKPSLSARLENVLSNVLAKVDSTSDNINAILGAENQAAFKSALADIAVVAHTLAARKDDIDSGLIKASQATEQIGPVITRIGRSAEAIEKMGNEVANAGKTVRAVGTNVERFSAETLPELERLLTGLQTLSASLRRLSEQTERNPAGLLFGRMPVPAGPGESSP